MAQELRLNEDATASNVTEFDSGEIDAVCLEINSLREESWQINEILKLEDYYSKEITDQLKQIMVPVKATFHVNPLTISENATVSDAVLNSDGTVSLLDERGQVLLRRSLGEFQRETFIKIIDEILPKVNDLVLSAPEKTSEGLSTIKRISMELKKIVYGESTSDLVANTVLGEE